MKGYDGPSYYKHNQPEETENPSWKKETSSGETHQLPGFTEESLSIQKNRTSTPFRFHTVPSAYFRSHKQRTVKRTNYDLLKKSLVKKNEEFLLFEAFLSEKGETLFLNNPQKETSNRHLASSEERLTAERQIKQPIRKRLSRSLAGIMEAEETNEKRTRNMSSLFANRENL